MKAHIADLSFSLTPGDVTAIQYAVSYHLQERPDYLSSECRSALDKLQRRGASLSKREAAAVGISLNEFLDTLSGTDSLDDPDLPQCARGESLSALAHRFQAKLLLLGVNVQRTQ